MRRHHATLLVGRPVRVAVLIVGRAEVADYRRRRCWGCRLPLLAVSELDGELEQAVETTASEGLADHAGTDAAGSPLRSRSGPDRVSPTSGGTLRSREGCRGNVRRPPGGWLKVRLLARPSARRAPLLLVCLGTAFAFIPAAPLGFAADSAPEAPVAKLAIVGPDVLEVELNDSGGKRRGTVPVIVTNSGTAKAEVSAVVVQVDAASKGCNAVAGSSDVKTVYPNNSATLSVKFEAAKGCDDEEGTLLVETSNASASPASKRFKFVRDAGSVNYGLPLGGSVAAFVMLSLILLGGQKRDGINDTVDMGPSWSFTDSWLTNVTALTAGLGLVLTTTGVLEQVLPGLNSGRLLALNVLFGGAVLFAPVIYSAAAKWEWKAQGADRKKKLDKLGRVWGLILASSVSVAGSIGIILIIEIIIAAADVGLLLKASLICLVGCAGAVVFAYALLWTREAIKKPAVANPHSTRTVETTSFHHSTSGSATP